MALKLYKCPVCDKTKETLKKDIPTCPHGELLINMEQQITAPNQKFMISANAAEGKSKLKDSDKMLKARARNHSRDVLGDETIQINLKNGLKESVSRNLLNEKGERRKKIDDI